MGGTVAAGVSGAVLAGGGSRRMGRDKRLLAVDAIPLLRRAAEAMAAVANDILIVVSPGGARLPNDLLAGIDVRIVADRRSDAGPLAGLEAALAEARHEIVVVVAADMPWLAPPLLAHLGERLAAAPPATHAAMVMSDRGPEPMPAAYRRGLLGTVSRLLDGGELRMGALADAIAVLILPPAEWRAHDPSGRSIVNINRPGDLERELERSA